MREHERRALTFDSEFLLVVTQEMSKINVFYSQKKLKLNLVYVHKIGSVSTAHSICVNTKGIIYLKNANVNTPHF